MDPTAAFEEERHRLFGVAYRMLGSVADADDVVQDAWLRWSNADHANVLNPAAFLTTITSRLALDRLKSAQRRRENYVGAWLPEPLATGSTSDPESASVMQESIMLGFLAVLERLGPVERAVFVLREVFDLGYDEVAKIVDRSQDNCRQIARRSRDHVRAERPRIASDPDRDRKLLDAFVAAVATGTPDQLVEMLHDDVVLVSDGGANVRAARHPIVGADRVTRFLTGIVNHAPTGEVALRFLHVNGQISLLIEQDGQAPTVFTLEPDATNNRIQRIFVLRNPDKMHGLDQAMVDQTELHRH